MCKQNWLELVFTWLISFLSRNAPAPWALPGPWAKPLAALQHWGIPTSKWQLEISNGIQIRPGCKVRGINKNQQSHHNCPKFLFFSSITKAMKQGGLNTKPAAFLKRQSISPLTRGKEIIITWLVASVRWKTAVAGKVVRMSCINYLTLAGKIILSVIWPLVSCSFW